VQRQQEKKEEWIEDLILIRLSINSINFGTNLPWVKGIQVCSNKGPGPLKKGDNNKKAKIGLDLTCESLLKNH
jgi:hypothetical protein